MNGPNAAPIAPVEPGQPLPGVLLSTADAPPGSRALGISVEMLAAQRAGHLINVADNFGAGWLDRENRRLRLQFHVVPLFDNAKTDRIGISVPGADEKIALSTTRIPSPLAGEKNPQLSWSALSRLVVDETIALPGWAAHSAKFELVAEVAGKWEKIGVIHVEPAAKGGHGYASALVNASPDTAGGWQAAGRKAWLMAQGLADRVRSSNRIFLFTVALPTLLSGLYFGLIASDVYISESKFIIRSPDKQSLSPLGMILKGADFGRAQDDSYSVQEFILSRDALRKLEEGMSLRKSFSSKNVDMFSRFAGLDWDDSFEALFKYYQKKVDVQIDGVSSIVTLTTRGFTAEDSQRANQLLLEMSEALVNQLNENGRQDMIRFAEREVAGAEKRDKEATLALARIQTGGARVGTGANALADKFTEYQRLTLEKEYADKMLAAAMASLEEARNQAVRKQLYLERIAQPSRPDMAMEPRRLRSVLAVFVLGLVLWGVLTMLIAGIREHQE